jgi:hypothetical protein
MGKHPNSLGGIWVIDSKVVIYGPARVDTAVPPLGNDHGRVGPVKFLLKICFGYRGKVFQLIFFFLFFYNFLDFFYVVIISRSKSRQLNRQWATMAVAPYKITRNPFPNNPYF